MDKEYPAVHLSKSAFIFGFAAASGPMMQPPSRNPSTLLLKNRSDLALEKFEDANK